MRVRIGDELNINDRRVRLVSASANTVAVRDLDSGLITELDESELVASLGRHRADTTEGLTADLVGLEQLDGPELPQVRFWVDFLTELERSLEIASASGEPLMTVYQSSVELLRARGTNVTERTVRRKLANFRLHGAAGVGSLRADSAFSRRVRTDERVIAAMGEVMDAQAHRSTGTRSRILEEVRVLLDQRFGVGVVHVPSRSTLYRMVEEMDRGRFTTGSAATRRSLQNRPDRPFASMGVFRPGEQVQIDSTKLDLFVRLADGTRVRPELTIMLDVATRTVLSAILRPVATKSIDLVVLLARALVPYDRRPGGQAETRSVVSDSLGNRGLMSAEEVREYHRRVPYIFPDTITTDRGRIFVSEHFRAACQRLGISLNVSAPYTPTDKGKVERMFQSINTGFVQFLDGYTGRNVDHRGPDAESQRLWSLPQLQALFDEWIAVEWQNRPHDSLRDPLFPSVQLSPNDMARAYRELAPELAVPFDEEIYLSLMPVQWRTIQQYGVTIDNRTYDSAGLTPIRRVRSPHKGRSGKWPIHYDPYNIQTVWLPLNGQWLPLQWVSGHLTGPMSGDVWALTREPGFLDRDAAAESRRVDHVRSLLSGRSTPDKATARILARSATVEADPMRLSEQSRAPLDELDLIPDQLDADGGHCEVMPKPVAGFGLIGDGEWDAR